MYFDVFLAFAWTWRLLIPLCEWLTNIDNLGASMSYRQCKVRTETRFFLLHFIADACSVAGANFAALVSKWNFAASPRTSTQEKESFRFPSEVVSNVILRLLFCTWFCTFLSILIFFNGDFRIDWLALLSTDPGIHRHDKLLCISCIHSIA